MKMRWMAVAVVALLASACGGTVEDETTDVNGVGASLHNGAADSDESIAGGGPCGTNYCGKGTFCCNASCGVCAPLGGGCLDVMCEVAQQPQETPSAIVVQPPAEEQLSTTCGGKICGAGTYCCNPSCGICAPKGASCIDIAC